MLCTKCGERPRVTYNSWCRNCINEDRRARFARRTPEERDRKNAYERGWASSAERRAASKARMRRWRSSRPEGYWKDWWAALTPVQRMKHYARCTARQAVREGRLQRSPCEVCGAKAEMHHDDYAKPLEVRWLCLKHHRAQHEAAQC